ncbi:MAG: SDR family NAD(P)-dependent oxidoreductase [Novosphingobium sp.]|uniref:SDR family NAD(P)-dependent oxidoreductase n=1 Tax=Novosphingobium sp. TaxID=1874826 RepID=UPI003B9B77E7
MKRFDGKVVLVTGGSQGIGQGIARRFHNEGARVFTAQRGNDAEFEGIEADLSDPASPARIIAEVVKRARRLDALVNNAGMMREARVEDMSLDDWQFNLAVNLTAPFLLIKAALPHLRETQGSIVNIGSIEGIGCNPQHASYSATKAGLHGLTRAVAVDHGEDGIRCNAVAPGWIDSELSEIYIASMPDPVAFRQKISKIHPVRRTGMPDDVAGLVAFLCSEDNGFITGQTYTIDGGRTVQLPLP